MNLRRVIFAATVATSTFIIAPAVASADHAETVCSPTSQTSNPYCQPACSSNPQIPASSPYCQPCQWDPSIPADSQECSDPCPYDYSIPADSEYCYPPEETTTTTQPEETTTTTQPEATTTTTQPEETTTSTTDPGTTTTTTNPSVDQGGPTTTTRAQTATTAPVQLPRTGSNNGSMSLIALVLLGLGVSIVVVSRRNQQA